MAECTQPAGLPEPSATDRALALLEDLIGCTPIAGSMLTAMFGQAVTRPFATRLQSFLAEVDERLRQLEQNGVLDYEELRNNEAFMSTVLQATQVASRTHNKAKREVLRNAVLNVALQSPPDEDIRMVFMGYIDDLTTWHVRILRFLDDPKGASDAAAVKPPLMIWSLLSATTATFPELADREEFLGLVYHDLGSRGLANVDDRALRLNVTPDGVLARRTTSLGKQFLRFVSDPESTTRKN